MGKKNNTNKCVSIDTTFNSTPPYKCSPDFTPAVRHADFPSSMRLMWNTRSGADMRH